MNERIEQLVRQLLEERGVEFDDQTVLYVVRNVLNSVPAVELRSADDEKLRSLVEANLPVGVPGENPPAESDVDTAELLAKYRLNPQLLTDEEKQILKERGLWDEEVDQPNENALMALQFLGQGVNPNLLAKAQIIGPLSDADLDALANLAIETYGLDMSLQPLEGEQEDSLRRRWVTELLNSGTQVAFDLLEDWGRREDRRYVDLRIDGQPLQVVQAVAERFDIAPSLAAAMLRVADEEGVSRTDMANAWAVAGIDLPDPATVEADPAAAEDAATRKLIGRTRRESLPEFRRIARAYRQAQEQYGPGLVSFVAVASPTLARQLWEDPWSLTNQQLDNLVGILKDFKPQTPVEETQYQWLLSRSAGLNPPGGRGGPRYSPEQVMEAARVLADAWNIPALPDDLVDSFASGDLGGIRSRLTAALPNPFRRDQGDVPASNTPPVPLDVAVRRALRDTPEYGELFGRKPEGMSEEEYVARFRSRSVALLGDVNQEAVVAGQRSGDPNTVGQQALLSGEAYRSSTFMERLARAAQTFREEL